jgi:hypothetical protein
LGSIQDFAAASNMGIHLGFGGNQEDAHRLSPHHWNTKLKENRSTSYMSELKKEQ